MIDDFFSEDVTTRSLVVRNVIIKNIVPMTAKIIIVFSKPVALSPLPSTSTSGSNKTCIINCATITATNLYEDKLFLSDILPVITPLSAE